jgi:hypothetical protein
MGRCDVNLRRTHPHIDGKQEGQPRRAAAVHARLTKTEAVQGNRRTAYRLPISSSMSLLLILDRSELNSSLKFAAHPRTSMKSLIRLGHLTTRMRCCSSTRTQTCGSFVEEGFYRGLPVPSLYKVPRCPRSHHAPGPIMPQCPSCPSAHLRTVSSSSSKSSSSSGSRSSLSFHSRRRCLGFPRFRKVHFVGLERANRRLVLLIFLSSLLVVRFFLPGNHQCQLTPRVPARQLSCVRFHLGAASASLAFARIASSSLSALVASTRIVPLSGCSDLPPL